MRLSDIVDINDLQENEEFVKADLSKEEDVVNVLKNVNQIIHFGGISVEKKWDVILKANIKG